MVGIWGNAINGKQKRRNIHCNGNRNGHGQQARITATCKRQRRYMYHEADNRLVLIHSSSRDLSRHHGCGRRRGMRVPHGLARSPTPRFCSCGGAQTHNPTFRNDPPHPPPPLNKIVPTVYMSVCFNNESLIL